jgi:hypothetical protein
MTRVEQLLQRVTELEERVCHLTQHHDEEIVAIHDDVDAVDHCQQLFHVNLRQAAARPKRRPAAVRRGKGKGIKRRAT